MDLYTELYFCAIISQSAGSATDKSPQGHLAHSVSFKMTSAGRMLPLTGASVEGLS